MLAAFKEPAEALRLELRELRLRVDVGWKVDVGLVGKCRKVDRLVDLEVQCFRKCAFQVSWWSGVS